MLVLAFNACGLPVFYWLKIQICKIKAEVAESCGVRSSESLSIFSSTEKDVKVENSSELCVAGKMYDIVKTETRNGVKIYHALGDNDEDTYIKKLAGAEKKSTHGTSLPAKASQHFDAIYFAGDNSHDLNTFPTFATADEPAVNDPRFRPQDFKDIFSPPPNRLIS